MRESDFIISMFIDNELSLDEKVEFVQRCHGENAFQEDALTLLEQEKVLRADPPGAPLLLEMTPCELRKLRFPRPITLVAAALALAVIGLSGILLRSQAGPAPIAEMASSVAHRFVLYDPSASQVEIAGSFTNWQKVALEPLRKSGYWEITLPIPPGDQSYTYILDGSVKVADPTAPVSESDDFGGQNSILFAEQKI
jgi:hypothetical protein